jgi:hypothetical protein
VSTIAPDWVQEAASLREQGLSEREIAESVGKANSTVHSWLAKVAAGEVEVPHANGNGSHPIPGQTTVDDHISEEPPPEDDPEWEPESKEQFEEEAGEAVGPMPPPSYEGRDGEIVYVEEIRVDGTHQTALDVGGRTAQSAALSLSGKATVIGSFRKGDVIEGRFKAVVRSAASTDKVDKKTGIVTDAADKFTAQIVDFEIDR